MVHTVTTFLMEKKNAVGLPRIEGSKDLLILEDDLQTTRTVYPATRRPVPADVITSRVESYDWLVVTLL